MSDDRRTATLRLTTSELAMLLRAVQERIAHADGDERDVLRSIAAGLTESILELRRPPERVRSMPWVGVPQATIRRWAVEQGIWVSPSGQVSADVIALYRAAHPDEP